MRGRKYPELQRLARADTYLAGTGLSVRAFAAAEEVSTKTIYRLLEDIQCYLGLPIEYDKRTKKRRYPDERLRIFTGWVHDRIIPRV
jgi:predicted DNA-binding transcriptional regulator YafY